MDEDKKIKLYLKGYEEGQKDAWSDINSLISRYDGWELKSRVESRIGTLYQELETKREELKENTGELDLGSKEGHGDELTSGEILWKPGDSYLFVEDKPSEAVDVLELVIESNIPIMFITRLSPDKILNRISDSSSLNKNSVMIILSSRKKSDDNLDGIKVKRIHPSNLTNLSNEIGAFLKKHDHSVILLSSISLLSNYKEPEKVLSFLHWTQDEVRENKACLVCSISENSVKSKFLGKVKSGFDLTFG